MPSAGVMLPMLLGSLLLAFAMVGLAVFVPAYRVEPRRADDRGGNGRPLASGMIGPRR